VKEVDYLIVGQGLAGTGLAWTALERGKSFHIVDRAEEFSSSKVAAGIINPITGGRLNLGWRVDDLWPVARQFYQAREQELGGSFLEERPLLRLFTDATQAEVWQNKQTAPAYQNYWAPLPEDVSENYRSEFGGFETRRSGNLLTRSYLEKSRQHFESLQSYEQGVIEPEAITPDADGVRWGDVQARYVIWCQGHENRANPWFGWVPIRPGKGEILTLHIAGLEESRIINRKQWLLPSSTSDEEFRTGSNFEWDAPHGDPTAAGRAEVESGLRGFLTRDFEVTGHEAAFRPMANQGRPLMGAHPQQPRLVLFNGLGAKGALIAPFCAGQLLDHLETGAPLDEDVTITRFWK